MIGNKKLDEKEATLFERMRTQMMTNIEVTLQNFHLSYETQSTAKLGHPFSFGVTLHRLKLTVSQKKAERDVISTDVLSDDTNGQEQNIKQGDDTDRLCGCQTHDGIVSHSIERVSLLFSSKKSV
jgi:hypothetical protein